MKHIRRLSHKLKMSDGDCFVCVYNFDNNVKTGSAYYPVMIYDPYDSHGSWYYQILAI